MTRYFTGKPCKNGHIAERHLANNTCVECQKERNRQDRTENPDKYKLKELNRKDRNSEKRKKSARKSYHKNIEKRRKYDKLRYNKNPEIKKQNALNWSKINSGKRNFIVQFRRKRIKTATPKWLTEEQKRQIRIFYIKAAELKGSFHVDHIIPISSPTICGLHVPWNLQILTKDENLKKGNKYDPRQ